MGDKATTLKGILLNAGSAIQELFEAAKARYAGGARYRQARGAQSLNYWIWDTKLKSRDLVFRPGPKTAREIEVDQTEAFGLEVVATVLKGGRRKVLPPELKEKAAVVLGRKDSGLFDFHRAEFAALDKFKYSLTALGLFSKARKKRAVMDTFTRLKEDYNLAQGSSGSLGAAASLVASR